MSITNMKSQEVVGYAVGFFAFLIWSFSVFISIEEVTLIFDWIMFGPIIFIMAVCHYLFSKNVIDEIEKIDDKISIKSNAVGIFLWSLIIVFLPPHSVIPKDFNMIGGYVLILLIYHLSKSHLDKSQKSKEFTFTYSLGLLMIFNHIAGFLIPFVLPK